MSKFAKVALTVGAAGAALVAGVVLVPKLLRRSTVPSAPAPMANAPAAPPKPVAVPQTSAGGGGTLSDINAGIKIADAALDLLDRLGLGNDDGGGFSFGGFSI
jgi:hypothetical protein